MSDACKGVKVLNSFLNTLCSDREGSFIPARKIEITTKILESKILMQTAFRSILLNYAVEFLGAVKDVVKAIPMRRDGYDTSSCGWR